MGVLAKGGRVRAYWESPPGLEAALARAPKGAGGDLLVLSDEVMHLQVTLPVGPGLELKDPNALRIRTRGHAGK